MLKNYIQTIRLKECTITICQNEEQCSCDPMMNNSKPLTWHEVEGIFVTTRNPIWIKFLDDGYVAPAILDLINDEIYALWAWDQKSGLGKKTYGKEWIAYQENPER